MGFLMASEGGRSSSGQPHSNRRTGLVAVVLAVCTSAVVVYAAAVGAFTPVMAAGAVAVAGLIAILSFHGAGGRVVAQDLAPLGNDVRGPVTVNAPRASEVAGHSGRNTDAA